MKPITAVLSIEDAPEATAQRLAATDLVERILLLVPPGQGGQRYVGRMVLDAIETSDPGSGSTVHAILERTTTPGLLRLDGVVDPHPTALRRMLNVIEGTGAAMVFGDYVAENADGSTTAIPLSDYLGGSLQDTFPFGPMQLWSTSALKRAVATHGPVTERKVHGWYDARLKASHEGAFVRLAEPLATTKPRDVRRSGEKVFDYLTASREAQIEAEGIATEHLERIGARLTGPFETYVADGDWAVEASVVIPVRNRIRTVRDAVRSALSQTVDVSFNVIVVDNHSTDGTTEALREIAATEPRLVHVTPERKDLGIGGCWNVAVFHPKVGRYVVQLDSDDLYQGNDTLQRMVSLLQSGCGLVVGSYTLVNMELNEIPPGLIDHKEWTDDNGANNALRIGGLGAPRGYPTALLREAPFPNASYGEDYAAVLRACRQYRIGRIYDSLYLCRRWEDNSDADLPPATKARYQAYKDGVRTLEIAARQRLLRQGDA
ncbi:MAG: glycosyltransferase family A protein [Myxococcota bacterium]